MVRRTNSRTPNEWARMTHMPVQGICRLYGEEHEKQMSFVNICMWHELYHVHPNVLIFIIRSDHTIIKSITLFFGGSRGKTKSQWCPYIQSRSGFYGIRNARAASSAPASSTLGKRTYRIETHANKIAIMFGWNQPTPGTDKTNMILIILEHVQHCGIFTLALDKGVQQRFIGSSIWSL